MIRSFVHAAALAALMLTGGCGLSPERDPSANGIGVEATIDPPANAAPPLKTVPPTPVDLGRYSSLDPADCRLIEQNRDEASYARYACPGVGGYKLETSESDLRHDVVVIDPDGRRTELQLSSLVARGAFNTLGKSAEWRGAPEEPSSVILRLNVADPASPTGPDISQLIVARLTAPACVVAIIPPGPDQNAEARQVASSPPNCIDQ